MFESVAGTFIQWNFCRVHPLAGTVDTSDAGAIARAEETYIANLKYAADKCTEVRGNEIPLVLRTCTFACGYCSL